MMRLLTQIFFFFLIIASATANDPEHRLDLNPLLAPFYHGVASGDPLDDAVVLWTRVTSTEPSVEVSWEVATDTSFRSGTVVASGTLTTSAARDYTVKIDATGLSSNTYYYYRFRTGDTYSMIGRTKTAPTADEVEQLRFALVSCSSLQHGYFNGYERITARNDVDAVLHLGDYVYEYGPGEYGDIRDHEPPKEMTELVDYRTRYAQYRLDPAVRNIHQQYPFITIWDDHETADNSYKDGAENHTPGAEGNWVDRLSYAAKAYNEWMPIRLPEPSNEQKLYRSFHYGDLADIFVLDTRIIGRDEQLGFLEALDPANANDPSRHLLGPTQLAWIQEQLSASTAKWKVIAQQVMVGPFKVFDLVLNSDQWDGYGAERKRLFDYIEQQGIDNIVVLTGDIHTSWAMDLPLASERYVPSTGENSLGVEFVTTSITSPGFPIGFIADFLKEQNKHMKFIELTRHGYGILDLTTNRVQDDFYFLDGIEQPGQGESYEISYYSLDGANHLQWTFDRTESIYPLPLQAPDPTDTTSGVPTPVIANAILEITGIYPNPVTDAFLHLQYFLQAEAFVEISLFDMSGALVYHTRPGQKARGIYVERLQLPALAAGTYQLVFRAGAEAVGTSLIKIE